MYQGPARIQVSNRGKDLFTLPYLNLRKEKKRKEKLGMFWDLCHSQATQNGKAVCLTQTYFFTSFFLTTHYQNPPGWKESQELLEAPLLPNTSSRSALLDVAGMLCEPCFLWHGSRCCRSGHLDISIELDRCLLIGSTIHLGRAAWNCKMVYYDSLISPGQTAQCIIF